MNNMEKGDDCGIEDEGFPDEFQCCVCLDLLYKPVILACGHIGCFWCVFQAMDTWQESHCPLCRKSYNHFPSICQLLHFLLLKMYPLAYRRRAKQMTEEEEKLGSFSPQFEHCLSFAHDAPEAVPNKDYAATGPPTSNCKPEGNLPDQGNSMPDNKNVRGTCKQVLINDLSCALCKQLLYRPVVLNCGHVYCEGCISNPNDKVCRCQVCPSLHPNGFPNVCLVLEHFLEEHFPEEYASRKEAVLKQVSCQHGNPSTCSTHAEQHVECSSLLHSSDFLSWLSSQGPKVHFGVGCDYCGVCPIVGERYKCKDCKEKMGFDLCEECYNSSSKLPGRFNQHHTPEHKFEVVQPVYYTGRLPGYSENEFEAASISSNGTSEDQEGTDATT